MKTPRSAGVRGILCLSALLAIMSVPRPEPSLDAPEPSSSLEVRLREAGCSVESYLSPRMEEVRVLLAQCAPAMANAMLEQVYAERVTLTDVEYEYVWVLVNGFWFLQCFERSVFQIDFGSEGTVLVTVREAMPVG